MCCYDSIKLRRCDCLDVLRNLLHVTFFWPAFGRCSATIVQEYMSGFLGILKRQQKAVAETDVVHADRQAGGCIRHALLLVLCGRGTREGAIPIGVPASVQSGKRSLLAGATPDPTVFPQIRQALGLSLRIHD